MSLWNTLPCSAVRELNRISQLLLSEPMRSSLLLHFLFLHNPGWISEAFLFFPPQVITLKFGNNVRDLLWNVYSYLSSVCNWSNKLIFWAINLANLNQLQVNQIASFHENITLDLKKKKKKTREIILMEQGWKYHGGHRWSLVRMKKNLKERNYRTNQKVPTLVNITDLNNLFLK